eukprot:6023365-Pyramimonas_sp.AAC.1
MHWSCACGRSVTICLSSSLTAPFQGWSSSDSGAGTLRPSLDDAAVASLCGVTSSGVSGLELLPSL